MARKGISLPQHCDSPLKSGLITALRASIPDLATKHQAKKLIKPIKANISFFTKMSSKGLQTHKLEAKHKST